jgi:hypothetical protein
LLTTSIPLSNETKMLHLIMYSRQANENQFVVRRSYHWKSLSANLLTTKHYTAEDVILYNLLHCNCMQKMILPDKRKCSCNLFLIVEGIYSRSHWPSVSILESEWTRHCSLHHKKNACTLTRARCCWKLTIYDYDITAVCCRWYVVL